MATRPVIVRFLEKVNRPEVGCWIWHGAITSAGYGNMSDWDGKIWTAHRLAYEMFVAPIPKGLLVLHRCHVPRCCNPSHLYVGTHADNARDMIEAGRAKSGARCATPPSIKEAVRVDRRPNFVIGDEVGLNPSTVARIKTPPPKYGKARPVQRKRVLIPGKIRHARPAAMASAGTDR